MSNAPESIYRLELLDSGVVYLESPPRDSVQIDESVEYIRKDKADERLQQLMWQYAGVRL